MTVTFSKRARNAAAAFIVRGDTPGEAHSVAPWCTNRITIQIRSDRRWGGVFVRSPPRVDYTTGEVHDAFMGETLPETTLEVACRKCDGCIRHKKKLWVSRAYHETIVAHRTWFGTLTFPPGIHGEALRECMATVWADGVDYHALTDPEREALEAGTLYKFVDRFWKRLRKAGYRFRYLCVAEPHQSGLIHFHVLVHEITPHNLPKAILEAQWGTGLSHWRLVQTGDKRAVWYVCKYLGKVGAKPRSSLHYGTALKLSRPRAKRTSEMPPSSTAATAEVGSTKQEPIERAVVQDEKT